MQNIFDFISRPLREVLSQKTPISSTTSPTKLPGYSPAKYQSFQSTPATKLPSLKPASTSIFETLSKPIASVVKPKTNKVPFEATKGGIALNTILGIPQAAREAFFPGRGFSEEEIKKARPSAKDLALGIPKVGAEFSSIIGSLTPGPTESGRESLISKFAQTRLGGKLADVGAKIEEFGKPKTAGEASAMRFGDIATFIPIGSIKTMRVGAQAAQDIAKTTNVGEIVSILKKEIPELADQAAEKLSPFLRDINVADDVEVFINRLRYYLNRAPGGAVDDATGLIPAELRPAVPGTRGITPPGTAVPAARGISSALDRSAAQAAQELGRLGATPTTTGVARATAGAPTPAVSQVPTPTSPREDIFNYLADNSKTLTNEQGVIQTEMRALRDDLNRGIINKDEARTIFEDLEARLRQTFRADDADTDFRYMAGKADENYNLSQAEAETRFRDLFDENEVQFLVKDAIKGADETIEIAGRYTPATIFRNPVVEVVQNGGRVADRVVYHEAFHTYLGEFMTKAERETILRNVMRSPSRPKQALMDRGVYNTASKRAEEWAADDFAAFVAGKQYATANKGLYQRILDKIRDWIRRATGLKKVYEDILSKNRSYRRNPAITKSDGIRYAGVPKKGGGLRPIKKIGDDTIKTPTHKGAYDKGRLLKGEYKGKPYTTDGFILEFEDLAFKEMPASPRPAPPSEAIDGLVERATRDVVSMGAPVQAGKLDSNYAIEFKVGDRFVAIQDQYYNYLAGKYKNLRLETSAKFADSPIAIYDGKDLKGLLMPIKGEIKNKLPIKAPEVVQKKTSVPARPPTGAPVGKGPEGKVSPTPPAQKTPGPQSQSVSKLSSSPKVDTQATEKAIVTVAKQTGDPVGTVKRVANSLSKIKTRVLEYGQDRTERVRLLVNRKDLSVDEATDPFLKMTLYDGRVQARIDKAQAESAALVAEMKKVGDMKGEKVRQIRREVSDYLVARHAPERNAALGDGAAGMTDAEARARLKELESGKGGAEIKAIADKAQALHNETLEVLRESGVISDKLFNTLRNKYKNHVPLQRIFDRDADVGPVLAGKGFDVSSTGIKRAKGSQKEVNDVLENIMLNHEQAILRAEKNRVDLSTLAFVRKNKDALEGLMEETQLPVIPVAKVTHKGQVFPEVMQKVESLVQKYGGNIERKLKTGKVFGKYNPGSNTITTRFGTSKDTLLHEFGHMLDTKFGLRNDPGFFSSEISAELRKVSDLRNGTLSYTRKAEEKIAEFIGMYFSDFKNAQRVAPKTTSKFTQFLTDKPELKELVKTMRSRERAEELVEEVVFARQQFTNDPRILSMYENGQKTYIKIEDPRLAAALKGTNKEPLGSLLQAVAPFTRLYSGLATRFDPGFALPNKIRDLQETAVYLASQKDIGFKGASKMVVKDTGSYKDVIDALRGKDTAGARLYNEMKEAGGTTGGFGLSTKKRVALNIEKLERLAESKTNRIANNLVEYVDNWNTIFEDSTRLSVYKQARSQGLSKEGAAALAKEASINFNRMGTGGPLINGLYMFANASIQGSVKMLRALKNPKVLGAVVATVGGSVAAVSSWNDQVDPDWREKTSKWDRLNGLVVAIPSTDDKFRYFTIPVSWGIKPIKVMADYAYDAVSGAGFDTESMLKDTLTAIAEAYNPAGGSDLISAMVPTILDTPVEIGRNKSWTGNRIRPTFDQNAPADIQYFASLGNTKIGQAAISISEILNDKMGIPVSPANMKYAYEQYVGGAGRTVSKVANVFSGLATGAPPALDEYPMISRFYKEREADEIGTQTGGEVDQLKNQLEDQSRARFKTKNEAEKTLDSLKAMSKEEAAKLLTDIKKNNPLLFDKIKDVASERAKNLSSTDKLVKQLGVANGERATYIITKLKELPSKEAKAQYLKDLKDKGLLSSDVLEQIKALLKQP